jgi:hypothetical protein
VLLRGGGLSGLQTEKRQPQKPRKKGEKGVFVVITTPPPKRTKYFLVGQ